MKSKGWSPVYSSVHGGTENENSMIVKDTSNGKFYKHYDFSDERSVIVNDETEVRGMTFAD